MCYLLRWHFCHVSFLSVSLLELGIGAGSEDTRMTGLPDGRKKIKIGLAVLIQYRRVIDSHPASQPASQPRCRSKYALCIYVSRAKLHLETKCRRNRLICGWNILENKHPLSFPSVHTRVTLFKTLTIVAFTVWNGVLATLPGMWERTVTIGSAGKAFGVTGWRLGWSFGQKDLINCLCAVHQSCTFTCPTPLQVTQCSQVYCNSSVYYSCSHYFVCDATSNRAQSKQLRKEASYLLHCDWYIIDLSTSYQQRTYCFDSTFRFCLTALLTGTHFPR